MTPIILLHGALGAAEQLRPLQRSLAGDTTVLAPDFAGHGQSDRSADTFSITDFAADVVRLMDEAGIAQADIFGYSMGGYVGMYLAQEQPQRMRKIATLGTKYLWTPDYAAVQRKMLDADVIAQKVPAFAGALATRHAGKDWKSILQKTAAMMTGLGDSESLPAFPSAIAQPALLMVGDRDSTVDIAETEQVRRGLKAGELAVLPGTPHPFEKVDITLLSHLLRAFFLR